MSIAADVGVALGEFRLDSRMSVEAGSVLALVGPNGSGKTTLLRTISGLQPIDRGTIRIAELVVDDPAADRFVPPERRSVGVVFQDYLLFPHLTARDNAAFALRVRGVARSHARRRADEWLDRLGVGSRRDAKPATLSGGQAQRVALARALAFSPDVLLLDEPLAAMDAGARDEIRRDLRHHLRDYPGAAIVVSHDPVDAAVLADHIAILDHGQLVQTGTVGEVLAHPCSRYVAELVGVNLFEGIGVDHDVELVGGGRVVVAEPVRGTVFVVVDPRAVMLSLDSPQGSARNSWLLQVNEIESIGERARVRLLGAVSLVAEVTSAAVAELDLHEGRPVWAAVKATEVRVSPR